MTLPSPQPCENAPRVTPAKMSYDRRCELEAIVASHAMAKDKGRVALALKDAMQALRYFEKLYNAKLEENGVDFESWFRLAQCAGILTGSQPECATVMDEICRQKAVDEYALQVAIPDSDERIEARRQARLVMEKTEAWTYDKEWRKKYNEMKLLREKEEHAASS